MPVASCCCWHQATYHQCWPTSRSEDHRCSTECHQGMRFIKRQAPASSNQMQNPFTHNRTALNGCVFCMQILEDAAGHDSELTSLTPAVLRKALRAAGNIVKPSETEDVLQYVIRDVIQPPLLGTDCLAGLHLILLTDNSVQKFACYGTKPVSPADTAQHPVKRFFLSGDGDSQHIYDLMSASKDQQVKPSPPWTCLSG